MDELWDVFCEDFGENWLRYNGTTLWFISFNSYHLFCPGVGWFSSSLFTDVGSGAAVWKHIHFGAVILRSIFSQIFAKDTPWLAHWVRYGASFVDPASDWYSASVPVNISLISYNIGPHYNGTWLYFKLNRTCNLVAITGAHSFRPATATYLKTRYP